MQLSSVSHEIVSDMSLLNIETQNILKGMGMTYDDADEYLLELIEKISEKCKQILLPRIAYAVFDNPVFDLKNQRVSLRDNDFYVGRIVSSFLQKSDYILVFACSIGSGVETLSKQLMLENESLEALIADLVGSEYTESLIEYFHQLIENELSSQNLKVSNRFSPGYCNWSVSEQHKLFSLLGAGNAGIRLTESSLMMPVKSVSGFIGIGQNLRKLDYKCQSCSSVNCLMRTNIKC